MAKIYSVNEITKYIKDILATDFLLANVSVLGEISNLKCNRNGHIYFSLKGENSVLSGVMFGGMRTGIQSEIKDGDQVVVTGKIDVYEPQGKYQLYARKIEKAGVGELQKRFEELKKKLYEMGLFDPAYKQPLPKYPMTIGIVTSPTAAALQDIIRVTRQRNPYARLILSPATVQGESAPQSILSALKKLDALHPDVIIIGRGGGSMEDLWCFNDEELCMAVFEAKTPIVSAVGHEIDFTLIDFVSDVRAATPSQAAELCAFDADRLLSDLDLSASVMENALKARIQTEKSRITDFEKRLTACHPKNVLLSYDKELTELAHRMRYFTEQRASALNARYLVLAERMEGLSPLKKLAHGFGYLSRDGRPLESVSQAQPGDRVAVTLHDGSLGLEVREVRRNERRKIND